jgi:hypothetical protein
MAGLQPRQVWQRRCINTHFCWKNPILCTIAEIRRGCVQMMLVTPPRPASASASSINCGSCVVFPQPVSPLTTNTWDDFTASKSSARFAKACNGECYSRANGRERCQQLAETSNITTRAVCVEVRSGTCDICTGAPSTMHFESQNLLLTPA